MTAGRPRPSTGPRRPGGPPAGGTARSRSPARRGGLHLAAALATGWFILPLLPVLGWAVADRWPYPSVLPGRLGLRGWATIWSTDTARATASSAVLGSLVALAATALGTMSGRALGWRLTRHRTRVALLLLSPVALPPMAIAMGLSSVLLRARIPAGAAVLAILTVYALPYTTYVVAARYAALDPQSEEQARLLGASRWQAISHVTLPALRPALLAAAFLAFLVGWSDYVVTLVIGGGQVVTLPMLIGAAAAGTGNEPVVAALSVVSVLPPLAALLLGRATAAASAGQRRRRGPSTAKADPADTSHRRTGARHRSEHA